MPRRGLDDPGLADDENEGRRGRDEVLVHERTSCIISLASNIIWLMGLSNDQRSHSTSLTDQLEDIHRQQESVSEIARAGCPGCLAVADVDSDWG